MIRTILFVFILSLSSTAFAQERLILICDVKFTQLITFGTNLEEKKGQGKLQIDINKRTFPSGHHLSGNDYVELKIKGIKDIDFSFLFYEKGKFRNSSGEFENRRVILP